MTITDELVQFEHCANFVLNKQYKFIKHVQIGSYGKVLLAKDITNGEQVAVKIMSKANKGSKFITRHELSILKKLNFQNNYICSLLNYFETDNYYWLVFEFCSNGDLYDYISNKLDPLNTKHLIHQLYQVLQTIHSKGIYHRDIKPENILIDSEKSIKLTDWGLSTLSKYAYDSCVGTEKYMAPETFFKQNDKNFYDTQLADYWSLGITLLYVLFKKCPWKLANLKDDNFKQFVTNPTILMNWYPKLSKFGYNCIIKLLQLNPIHRSLDQFYELSYLKGFHESFVVLDEVEYYENLTSCDVEIGQVDEISISDDVVAVDDDDELLFGLEIGNELGDEAVSIDRDSTSNSVVDKDDLFDDYTKFDTQDGSFKYNTPLTPAIQTPLNKMRTSKSNEDLIDNSLKRGLNVNMIKNSPLKFEKLDWY